ncbi:MAG: PKD domain-containing protein [Microthrixaceae bacterium]
MTMIETLMALALTALIMVPMLGWAFFAFQSQVDTREQSLQGSGIGMTRTYLARDIASADWAATTGSDAVDCTGREGAGGRVLLVASGTAGRAVYTESESLDRPGNYSLWRRSCATAGGPATGAVELVRVQRNASTATCIQGTADPGRCRRVVVRLVLPDSKALTLSASVRSDRAGTVDQPVADPIPPTVVLAVSPTAGFRGTQFNFSSTGSADPAGTTVRFLWEFGDGTTSTAANPTKTYGAVGSFTAVLTVTTAGGTTATDYVVVRVDNRVPTAVIAAPADNSSVFRGQTVSFSSAGSGDGADAAFGGRIVSQVWDFGDGTSSTAANPTKSYDQLSPAGGFVVRLTVTDDLGAQNQAQIRVVVANRLPSVVINATPTSGASPLVVNLTSTVTDETTMTTNPAITYAWDYGDGRTSTVANPGNVTFTGSGTRTVRLTITDDAAATASATRTITLNTPPTAAFTLTPSSGRAPTSVSFTNSSTDADGTIASYAWNFGNGATSTVRSPSAQTFTFNNAASDTFVSNTYTVTLTVTDNGGATATTTQTVSITGAPAPTNLRRTGSGSSGGRRYLDMAWNSVTNVNQYQVEATCTSNNCTDVITTTSATTTVRVTTLTNSSRNYNVRVRARDTSTGKWGAWSTIVGTNT